MTTSLARTAGITNVPLRLLALPLCRDPELIYYYAHKRKEGRISDGGKGKKRENEEAEPSILANEAEKAGDKASDAVKNVETNSLTISEKIPRYISKPRHAGDYARHDTR